MRWGDVGGGKGMRPKRSPRYSVSGFEEVGAPFLAACHAVSNPASRRVIEKCGFHYDHDAVCHRYDGSPVICRTYSLLVSEWEEFSAAQTPEPIDI